MESCNPTKTVIRLHACRHVSVYTCLKVYKNAYETASVCSVSYLQVLTRMYFYKTTIFIAQISKTKVCKQQCSLAVNQPLLTENS